MGEMYASAAEAALHEAAIDALAAELHRPPEEVKRYYEREIMTLLEGARIRDFLSVCATRRTRESMRRDQPH
jgi:hypothetical protein